MNSGVLVIVARDQALRRIHGNPDILALRLEVSVPEWLRSRVLIVEQRLSRGDMERILAAFDMFGARG